jgi:DNA replication ATP-dependent helicase Dna2
MQKKPKVSDENLVTWLESPPLKHFKAPESSSSVLGSSSPNQNLMTPLVLKLQRKSQQVMEVANPFLELVQSMKSEIPFLAPPLKIRDYHRWLVLQITLKTTDSLQIRALDPRTRRVLHVCFIGDWAECIFTPGKYIHVILPNGGLLDVEEELILIGNDELVVIDPDELISTTMASDSFHCLRRAMLKDKVRLVGTSNAVMIEGNVIHSLFQEAMVSNIFSKEWLTLKLSEIIKENAEQLYSLGLAERDMMQKLEATIPQIISWKESNDRSTGIRVTKTLAVEERVWSSKFGLKGNIDLTVQIQGPGIPAAIAPLELKTGKAQSISHTAQTSLYTLMLSDRHDIVVDKGLLVYLQKLESSLIEPKLHEKRGLLIGRNNVAAYMHNKLMPPLLQNPDTCRRCFLKKECLVYHKTIEDGTTESSGTGALFEEETNYITSRHIEFLKEWERVISIEERRVIRNTRDLWTVDSAIREKQGSCMNGLIIRNRSKLASSQARFRYQYDLVYMKNRSNDGFKATHLIDGDPIIVTEQGSSHPVAVGFVSRLSLSMISISTDKPIEVDQFMDMVGNENEKTPTQPRRKVFCIDKDGYASGMGSVRGSLFDLFFHIESRRRALIVDLAPPIFLAEDASWLRSVKSELNENQKTALRRVASCRDYSLILGMPGTGKTTTIASLIQMLISRGKSVFLTSFTHSAVDNVLLKLQDMQVPFVRLGQIDKMHSRIKEVALNQRSELDSTEKMIEFYDKALVIASTALGIGHPVLMRKRFDYCIVDESSQIALPVCLGPLQFADKFVLVGDHYQLPPLFAQDDNRSSETISLFKHLCQAHPDAVTSLHTQYRMNKDIMLLSNHLIYDYRLNSIQSVLNAKLVLPKADTFLQTLHAESDCRGLGCWIEASLNPDVSVLFCNTDLIPGQEVKNGSWIENPIEVILVNQVRLFFDRVASCIFAIKRPL